MALTHAAKYTNEVGAAMYGFASAVTLGFDRAWELTIFTVDDCLVLSFALYAFVFFCPTNMPKGGIGEMDSYRTNFTEQHDDYHDETTRNDDIPPANQLDPDAFAVRQLWTK